AMSSPSSSASRSRVARLRVPGFLPQGLPERPGTNRPCASRVEESCIPSMAFTLVDDAYVHDTFPVCPNQEKFSYFGHIPQDPAGLFADLSEGSGFERYPVNTGQ